MGKLFDFGMVFEQIPDLLEYLPVTLGLALLAMSIGLILGFFMAIVKIKKTPGLYQVVNFVISFLRGTPVLVQLYISFFGIPMFLKFLNQKLGTNFAIADISGFFYAMIALGLSESAFCAEIIRSALISVSDGQIEAAYAIGMNYPQALRRIILPSAIAVALPNLGNALIAIIKGTSLAFTCAVVEITARGRILAGRTYRYFETYVSLAIVYWIITIIIERSIRAIEKKIKIPEQVQLVSEAATNDKN
jgi:polar amino acid transport system permease protein